MPASVATDIKCQHCGDKCPDASIHLDDYVFCCSGCKTVFEILNTHGMTEYYELEKAPGIKVSAVTNSEKFQYLDSEEIQKKILKFDEGGIRKAVFSVPQVHCSSCVWLLENLNVLNDSILASQIQFSKKEATITWRSENLTLRALVELLTSLGYEPEINLAQEGTVKKKSGDKKLIYKLGVAGFCFGNIMLFAFPEYLGMNESFPTFQKYFGWLSLFLAIPACFYAGQDYLTSAWKSVRRRFINMDVPIAIGIVALFIRSSYEILSETGAGYLDSLSGLIFFLLIGKWFQQKTYQALSFERDYKSYFPLAVARKKGSETEIVELNKLQVGDCIVLRNSELIPADGLLSDGKANIDYSFVTGESETVRKAQGEVIYAGGRQIGSKIEMVLTNTPESSYLTHLWNQDAFSKNVEDQRLPSLANVVSKYFTWVVLGITLVTALYWTKTDPDKLWNAITAVLIVACPCALALSIPFAYGNTMRVMGRNGLYLKNSQVVEKMRATSSAVFDKTGTLTHRDLKHVTFNGPALTDYEMLVLKSVMTNSVHPLSNAIANHIAVKEELLTAENYQEFPGAGLKAYVNSEEVLIGSARHVGANVEKGEVLSGLVYIKISGKLKGYFVVTAEYREGIDRLLGTMKKWFRLHMLSGDSKIDKKVFAPYFEKECMHSQLTPEQKMEYIENLHGYDEKVMMIGDGLNDAGALQSANVGIAVVEKEHQFSPACDAILNARSFDKIPGFIKFSDWAVQVVKICFIISFLYNIVGLSFAVTANLSPFVAAILMPLSSITVVAVATFLVIVGGRRLLRG